MILAYYVIWLGPAHWPISEALTWAWLTELTIECLGLYLWAIVGIVRARRRRGSI